MQTTPRPRQAGCGNGVRESFRKNVTCWSDAFGGVLLRQNCMNQEIEKGWVQMRNDAWHMLEECDDANRFSGDGCSADCFVEDAFVCTTSSVTGRADFCRRNAPGGLLELLAERGFLEGWANIAQVEGRESLPSAAGWMRMSLLSYTSNSQTQFAELRNANFEMNARAGARQQADWDARLFSCACQSFLTFQHVLFFPHRSMHEIRHSLISISYPR